MPPQQTQRRSLDTIGIWALTATLIVSLFIFIPSVKIPFIATKTFLLAAGALVTLAIYILARLSRGNVIFPPWILIGALWLPVVAYLLSSLLSGATFTNAFWGSALETDTLGYILVVAALGTLTALLVRRAEHYHSFLRASAIVFAVAVALGVLAVIIGQFAPGVIAPSFSLIGSYDDLAFLLGLGVVSALITLRFLEVSMRARRILIGSIAGALFLLAIANSSVVWVLVALVSLGLFVESIMRRSNSSSNNADIDELDVITESAPVETEEGSHSMVLPLTVLAVSLFFIIGGTLGTALANALGVNVVSVRPSWESTLSIAQETYSTNPVFGTGPGTFGVEWLKNRDASLNSTVFWNTNFTSGIGFIPTSFVTTGLVGALAWAGLLGLLLVFGFRMLIQRAPKDGFIRYVAILSFVASLFLFTVAICGVPNATILSLAFVFTGLFISTTRFAEGSGQWGIIFSRSPRLGFVIVFSLTIVLLGSVVAAYTLVGHYVAASQLASANSSFTSIGDLDAANKAAQNSISFAPSATAYQIQAAVANAKLNQIVSSAGAGMTASEAQTAFQEVLSTGINAALTATRLAPSDYQNWILLGGLYAQAVPLDVAGAYDSAKTAYEKAQELNPTDPQIPYVLAKLNIANKNLEEASENLKAAVALKQDYTAAIFLLSQVEVQRGNVADALSAALAAAYFTPNDPNILFQIGILRAASNSLTEAAGALSAAIEVSPQFANARYFLSAVYAKQGDFKNALLQMQAVADLSPENAQAVASQITSLEAGKNPFPANLLSLNPEPVSQ
jgi:tetratricopeptide (TPR) repeat protein